MIGSEMDLMIRFLWMACFFFVLLFHQIATPIIWFIRFLEHNWLVDFGLANLRGWYGAVYCSSPTVVCLARQHSDGSTADLMLVQRLRRWPSIKPALDHWIALLWILRYGPPAVKATPARRPEQAQQRKKPSGVSC